MINTTDYCCYYFLQHMLHPSIEDKKAEALMKWQDSIRKLDINCDENEWNRYWSKHYPKYLEEIENNYKKVKEIYEKELLRLEELHQKYYNKKIKIVSRKDYLKREIETEQRIIDWFSFLDTTEEEKKITNQRRDKIKEYLKELKELDNEK